MHQQAALRDRLSADASTRQNTSFADRFGPYALKAELRRVVQDENRPFVAA